VSCSAQLAQGGHFNQKIHGSGFLHMLSWKFIFGNTFNIIKDRATQARHFKPIGFDFGPTLENLRIFKNVLAQNVRLPLVKHNFEAVFDVLCTKCLQDSRQPALRLRWRVAGWCHSQRTTTLVVIGGKLSKRKYQCAPKSESYRKNSELVGDWRQRLELITPYGKEYYLIRVRGF